MERVQTLSNKLQEQLSQNASADQLLLTVQMLHSELMYLKQMQPDTPEQKGASIRLAPFYENKASTAEKEDVPEERTIEVLKIDEAEVEAELEEIKRNAEIRNNISAQNKPQLLFDPLDDIPTLAHQAPLQETKMEEKPQQKREVNENIISSKENSVNDKLKQIKIELSDKLQEVSIKDLKKGIGVNDRFLFIRELFRGDEVMYERSIKTINGFSIFPEAEYWIKRELKLKLGWSDTNEVVKQFDQLVRRRFS
jgi:hypothetical protein